MKRLKVLVLALAAFGLQASAQHTAEDRAKKMTEHLDQKVELSDEQKQIITQMNTDFAIRMMEMKKSEDFDHKKMRALRQEHRDQVKSHLTESQVATLKQKREEQRDIRKKLKAELREYRKANITPVMIEKRGEFEQKLSAEEKATIEKLRAEKKAKIEERKALIKEEKMEMRKKGKSDEFRAKRKEEHKAMRAELKPILDTHKEDLEAIEAEIAPLRATWKKDMEAIKAKYKDQGLEMHHNRGHKKGQASKKGKKGKKGKKNGKDKGNGAMKAHFLLLDPAVPVQETPGED